jgi:hypothetical protein
VLIDAPLDPGFSLTGVKLWLVIVLVFPAIASFYSAYKASRLTVNGVLAQLWKEIDAKNPGKGYGIQVISTWYWYERWIEEVRNHCNNNKEHYQ